jgi:Lariat debranching enzyme, C-terminal domain.
MHVKFNAQYDNTYFLALDKDIRPREFIEILNIPGEPGLLSPDPEWLGITGLLSDDQFYQYYPDL